MTGQIVTYALATVGVIMLLCAVVNGELRVRAITREIAAMKIVIVNQDDRIREQQKLLRAAAMAMKEVAHAD